MNSTENHETLRILIVEPGKHPRPATIPHTLKDMQSVVGGCIQAIYPWEDTLAAIVCDDEGLLKGYQQGRKSAHGYLRNLLHLRLG